MKIINGVIKDEKVIVKLFPNIEQGPMLKVHAVVLHRTGGSNFQGTLDAYSDPAKTTGAHFLITKNGAIFQTARLTHRARHVGYIQARCQNEDTCTNVQKKELWQANQKKTWAKDIQRIEQAKKYPERYAMNSDSIGVEIVGQYLQAQKKYEDATLAQLDATKVLLAALLKNYKLGFQDVYAHGEIGRKGAANEGSIVLQKIRLLMSKG